MRHLRTLKIGPGLWTTGFSVFSNPVSMTDRFLFHVYEPISDLQKNEIGRCRNRFKSIASILSGYRFSLDMKF
ncbi:hypothetical protein [Leptospira weilii]|uniref:hypothetical protein n=1 Tax=Leptospira weilii TaxID=28184 RepID=UPI001F31C987|nr:hypothetical protein [Leptospira weilii]